MVDAYDCCAHRWQSCLVHHRRRVHAGQRQPSSQGLPKFLFDAQHLRQLYSLLVRELWPRLRDEPDSPTACRPVWTMYRMFMVHIMYICCDRVYACTINTLHHHQQMGERSTLLSYWHHAHMTRVSFLKQSWSFISITEASTSDINPNLWSRPKTFWCRRSWKGGPVFQKTTCTSSAFGRNSLGFVVEIRYISPCLRMKWHLFRFSICDCRVFVFDACSKRCCSNFDGNMVPIKTCQACIVECHDDRDICQSLGALFVHSIKFISCILWACFCTCNHVRKCAVSPERYRLRLHLFEQITHLLWRSFLGTRWPERGYVPLVNT